MRFQRFLKILSLFFATFSSNVRAQDHAAQIAAVQEKWTDGNISDVALVLGAPNKDIPANPRYLINEIGGFSQNKKGPVVLMDFGIVLQGHSELHGGFQSDPLYRNLSGLDRNWKQPDVDGTFVIISPKSLQEGLDAEVEANPRVVRGVNLTRKARDISGYGSEKNVFVKASDPVHAFADLIQLEAVTTLRINLLDGREPASILRLVEILERLKKMNRVSLNVEVHLFANMGSSNSQFSVQKYLFANKTLKEDYPFAKFDITDTVHEEKRALALDSFEVRSWANDLWSAVVHDQGRPAVSEVETFVGAIQSKKQKVDLYSEMERLRLDQKIIAGIQATEGYLDVRAGDVDLAKFATLKKNLPRSKAKAEEMLRQVEEFQVVARKKRAEHARIFEAWKSEFTKSIERVR